ncbi:MAG TPA: hypothetical protein VHE30_11180 [Polyangiaceae bacterium]|nr:hypothetical protein [Polyangiaceae bacterium]
MRVGFFTSGDIGGGHLSRALAIRRGLARTGRPFEFRVFYARLPLRPPEELDVVSVDAGEVLVNPATAKDSLTARAIREFSPDVLLVDVSWFELRHVLPLPGIEPWLLLRWAHPELLGGPLNRGFPRDHYARIIAIEPIAFPDIQDRMDPIVGCNPDECHPPSALREHLGVPLDRKLSLVVQTGLPHEIAELEAYERERSPDHVVVATSLHHERRLFPIAPYLRGADRIVGGTGYNLFWETRWLGLADRTELHVFRRLVDDQGPRLRTKDTRMKENGADTLARALFGFGR